MTSTERRHTRLSQEADDALLFLKPRAGEVNTEQIGAWLRAGGPSPSVRPDLSGSYWNRPPEFDCRSPVSSSSRWENTSSPIRRAYNDFSSPSYATSSTAKSHSKFSHSPKKGKKKESPNRKPTRTSRKSVCSPKAEIELKRGETSSRRKFLEQSTKTLEGRRSTAPPHEHPGVDKFVNKHSELVRFQTASRSCANNKGGQSCKSARRRQDVESEGTPMSTLGFGIQDDNSTPSSLEHNESYVGNNMGSPLTSPSMRTTRRIPSGLLGEQQQPLQQLPQLPQQSPLSQLQPQLQPQMLQQPQLKPSKTIQFKLGLDMIPWEEQLQNEEYVESHFPTTQLDAVREALQAHELLLLILVASSTTVWIVSAGIGVATGVWWLPLAALIWALTGCITYALALYFQCPMFFGSAVVSAPVIGVHILLLILIKLVSSTTKISSLEIITFTLSVVGVVPYAVYARFAWLRGKNLMREKILLYMTSTDENI